MSRRAREKSQAVSAKSCRRSISKAMRTCSRCGKSAARISPCTKRSRSGHSGSIAARLAQLVGVARREVEPVDGLERLHFLQRCGRERRLALEGVQHDSLEEVAERHIELGSERLEHLEQPGLEAYTGLSAGDLLHGRLWYHVTKVPEKSFGPGRCRGRAAAARLRVGAAGGVVLKWRHFSALIRAPCRARATSPVTASTGRSASAPPRSCPCRARKWSSSAGTAATSSSSPGMRTSITRASAW